MTIHDVASVFGIGASLVAVATALVAMRPTYRAGAGIALYLALRFTPDLLGPEQVALKWLAFAGEQVLFTLGAATLFVLAFEEQERNQEDRKGSAGPQAMDK